MNNEEIKNDAQQPTIEPVASSHIPTTMQPQVGTEEEPGSKDTPIPAIHTLEGDLFAAMKDEDYGNNIVKIVTNPKANTNARFTPSHENAETMEGDRKNIFNKYLKYILILVVVLIGGGISMVLYINRGESQDIIDGGNATTTASTTPVVRKTAVINPEAFQNLSIRDLDKIAIIKTINTTKVKLRDVKIAPGTTVGFTTDVDIKTFFEKLRYTGPDSFIRALADDYAFGLFTDRSQTFEPYILVRVNSYDLAFAGLLEWESFMPVDLKDIYAKEKLNIATTSEETTSTTTSKTISATTTNGQRIAPTVSEKLTENIKFTDQVIKNIDTRMYVNTNNNLTIVYGFINKEYILITGGADSFIDIRNKLLTKNILR